MKANRMSTSLRAKCLQYPAQGTRENIRVSPIVGVRFEAEKQVHDQLGADADRYALDGVDDHESRGNFVY